MVTVSRKQYIRIQYLECCDSEMCMFILFYFERVYDIFVSIHRLISL